MINANQCACCNLFMLFSNDPNEYTNMNISPVIITCPHVILYKYMKSLHYISPSTMIQKASLWLGSQFHDLLLLSRSHSGWLNCARFGVIFPNCVTIPINRLRSEIFCGAGISQMAAVLSGSNLIPSLLMT